MIAIIDYNAGNIRSVMCALRKLGMEAQLTSSGADLDDAAGIILPGVGAFSRAMEELAARGLILPMVEQARSGKPFLGICLGHQLLFSESHEHGVHPGLNLLPGRVRRFAPGLKVPHMGWNRIRFQRDSGLLEGLEDGSFFYFAHSFCTEPGDDDVCLTRTDYGGLFASSVQKDNIFGVQFHPEKSGRQGLKMLENFCRLCR